MGQLQMPIRLRSLWIGHTVRTSWKTAVHDKWRIVQSPYRGSCSKGFTLVNSLKECNWKLYILSTWNEKHVKGVISTVAISADAQGWLLNYVQKQIQYPLGLKNKSAKDTALESGSFTYYPHNEISLLGYIMGWSIVSTM